MRIRIKSRPFGEIEIDEQQVIDFPEGILGFDFIKKFAVIDADNEKSPFKWLQAFDEPDLAFVIIRPVDFMRSYKLKVSSADLEFIGCKKAGEALVFAIVTIPSNPSEMTANLQGPIIINPSKKIGKQAISLNERHVVRHGILEEMKKSPGGKG